MARGKQTVKQVEVEEVSESMYEVGSMIRFMGYSDDVPEKDRVLEDGEIYEVAELNAEGDGLAVRIDNPDFNPKKKANPDTNPEQVLVDLFFDEVEPAEEEAEEEPAEEEPVESEPEVEEEEPVRKTRASNKPAAKGKLEAKSKPGAKGKTGAKGKPAAKGKLEAKGRPGAKGKAVVGPTEDDKYGELDEEDADILELVKDNEGDLVSLANELLEESAGIDYRLGGVLYHIRLSKSYKELDPRYAENKGFELFVSEQLNVEYRKAMYLIDIYYKFNLFGIPADKVQEIGWTKASKIAAVMTEDNAEELVEAAEAQSSAELSDTIKEGYSRVGDGRSETRKKITFKFRLFEDSGKSVATILEAAAKQMSFSNLDEAFEHIVTEWGAEHVKVSRASKATASTSAKPAVKRTTNASARA